MNLHTSENITHDFVNFSTTTVKTMLTSEEDFEFDDIYIVIAGLSNTYSQYVTTYEEYQVQRYEVSCKSMKLTTNIRLPLSKDNWNTDKREILVIQIFNHIILFCIDKR